MRTTTVNQDGNSVTITTEDIDGLTATDIAEMVRDAMLGCGYHPSSVSEAMMGVGGQYLPGEAE